MGREVEKGVNKGGGANASILLNSLLILISLKEHHVYSECILEMDTMARCYYFNDKFGDFEPYSSPRRITYTTWMTASTGSVSAAPV